MAHTVDEFAREGKSWDAEGQFVYLSALCHGNAPVNNNATNLTTLNARIPQTSSPTSTLVHPLTFEMTSHHGETGDLEETMSITVCHLERGPTAEDDPTPDAGKDRILIYWSATFHKTIRGRDHLGWRV